MQGPGNAIALGLVALAAALLPGCTTSPRLGDRVPATFGDTSSARILCPPGDPFCGTFDPGPGLDPDPDNCGPTVAAKIEALPGTIAQGQSTTLNWSVAFPYACVPGVIALNGQPVAAQGSMTVAPMSNHPYAITVGGIPVAHTAVFVVLPNPVRIKGSTDEWKRLLVQAIADPLPNLEMTPQPERPGRTVLLAHDVDMDLTGYENLHISQGVTLTSELPPPGVDGAMAAMRIGVVTALDQGPVARTAQRPGPRLYTRSRPKPLFHIQCNGTDIFGDRVRLVGFRLQGPHYDTEEGDDNLERGIMITSCVGVEIANMEISGWSGQGIYVRDRFDRNSDPGDVQIHGNFFHHNQHLGGNGYGVEASAGSRISIERNVFDFNRHAIAASGADGTGYTARHNLILKGGGYHDSYPIYGAYYTHQFDVHGTDHCGISSLFSDSLYNCGQAGEQFEFSHNAFQYTRGNAIKVRGNPVVGAVVANNVFAHDSRGDAIVQNLDLGTDLNLIDVQPNNRFDIDTYGEYGVCDFDDDGMDDLFLATGVSWWYASAAKNHWVFLGARNARLAQVGLGDFDRDGRCDVFAVQGDDFGIFSGGTQDWTSLGTHAVPFNQLRFGDFNGDGWVDVFRRAPDGQWSAISPGIYDWVLLQSSSSPLSALRFGDFDGNGVTDVASIVGGKWAVSWDARSTWQQLNPTLSSSLASVYIGNVDGLPGDDIVRYVRTSAIGAKWEVSSGGASPWSTLTSFTYPDTFAMRVLNPTGRMKTFVGRFDRWQGADLLALEFTRRSRIFSKGHANLEPHGRYAH